MIRIAIQSKGRLHDDSMALLAEADVKLSESKRTLISDSTSFPLQALYMRDDDIPETVASGVADIGIVGENEYLERGFDAEVQVINGSVEISPAIGLADAIFDIVSSGSTLVSNNLREVETVIRSEAILIGNKNMSDEKREILKELLFRFKAVRSAEDRKYVLMNVPRTKLDDIIGILPGIKSPTVMPLADKDWCSVHTVLEEKRFWEIIGQLKAAGAQGILVLPIEKMIL